MLTATLFSRLLLPLFMLTFVIGAAVLWARTKRFAALVQCIACSLIFLFLLADLVAFHLMPTGKPELLDFMRDPNVRRVGEVVLIICLFGFPGGYLWYALREKRI